MWIVSLNLSLFFGRSSATVLMLKPVMKIRMLILHTGTSREVMPPAPMGWPPLVCLQELSSPFHWILEPDGSSALFSAENLIWMLAVELCVLSSVFGASPLLGLSGGS